MSWGYTDTDNATGIHGEAQNGSMKATMFSNDGVTEANLTIQRLLKEGYPPEAIEDALKAVQHAIQNGIPVSRMPATSVLPEAVLAEIYDEAAVQTGAPASAELEAQIQSQEQTLIEEMMSRDGGSHSVDSTVASPRALNGNNKTLDMLSATSLNQLHGMPADARDAAKAEGHSLLASCEMDKENHTPGILGELSGPTVGQQQQREAGMFV